MWSLACSRSLSGMRQHLLQAPARRDDDEARKKPVRRVDPGAARSARARWSPSGPDGGRHSHGSGRIPGNRSVGGRRRRQRPDRRRLPLRRELSPHLDIRHLRPARSKAAEHHAARLQPVLDGRRRHQREGPDLPAGVAADPSRLGRARQDQARPARPTGGSRRSHAYLRPRLQVGLRIIPRPFDRRPA